jgi:hypothetical protein
MRASFGNDHIGSEGLAQDGMILFRGPSALICQKVSGLKDIGSTMRSRESCRIGYLATLFVSACLFTGGCAGNGNGTSAGGTGGNPAETGGTPATTGGVGGGTGGTVATTASGVAGGTVAIGGTPATGGTATGGAGGSTAASGKIFSQCRFHFGTTMASGALVAQLDFFTPGWMMGTFNQKSVCTSTNPGGSLAGLVPVDVTYISANYVKNKYELCDCNVSGCSGGTLCTYGSQYITQEWANILAAYTSNSTGFAACLGGRPIIFEMEPDWYQYTGGGETQPWTAAQAGTNMTALVNALKSSLPNAVFSMDISPWISNNGANWYPNFDMTLFTFINTSGGGTDAGNVKIRANNNMTWAGVHQVTGKSILADTGYGAAGAPAGEDTAWDDPVNINARMLDGVISISQYSPSSTWGTTIASIRSQLNTPPNCY